jgi:hypothetical protein
MDRLAETLERFNRKERHLLVRAALGHKDTPLTLSAGFRELVAKKLGGKMCIPEDAWWATDYHLSWIAGALAIYARAGSLEEPRPNPPSEGGRQLVEGNQEDIDLIIAFKNQIILIEAKAYGEFGHEQLSSKLARLELLHHNEQRIKFHFILISPAPPPNLALKWPKWAFCGEGTPWIQLDLDPTNSVLRVTRCDEAGRGSACGKWWRIIED